jgi:glutamate carboxypeptidase
MPRRRYHGRAIAEENPMSARAYQDELQRSLPEMLRMIEETVNIDSGSYHDVGVKAVQDVIGKALGELGFRIERQALAGRGDLFTASLTLGRGPTLLILGHADTVWPAGTVAEWPFSRSGERITGPGVGDMKSSLVMAAFALRLLLQKGLSGLGQIKYLLVPDEELGSPQSRGWIEGHAREADFCLTLEPCRPNGGVVIGRGAVGAVYVEAKGISAHCGSAWDKGASAVKALAGLVGELEALTQFDKEIIASVGILRGGAARQVVPHEAELHLDLRAPDDVSAADLLDKVKAILAGPPADPRVTISVRGGFTRPAFPTRAGTKALYAIAEEICRDLQAPLFEVRSRGGSDGSFAAGLGVPTLDGMGPICHETCSRREVVEVPSIAQRGALFAGIIAAVAAGRPVPKG